MDARAFAAGEHDAAELRRDDAAKCRKVAEDSYAANSYWMTDDQKLGFANAMLSGDGVFAQAPPHEDAGHTRLGYGNGMLDDGDAHYAAGRYQHAFDCYDAQPNPGFPTGASFHFSCAEDDFASARTCYAAAKSWFQYAFQQTVAP